VRSVEKKDHLIVGRTQNNVGCIYIFEGISCGFFLPKLHSDEERYLLASLGWKYKPQFNLLPDSLLVIAPKKHA